uniref:Transthyretin-like family protein n=1 Tax=Ditylenchus dipsaci TaxID=166011 RepID=A0A915E7K8_9BILA
MHHLCLGGVKNRDLSELVEHGRRRWLWSFPLVGALYDRSPYQLPLANGIRLQGVAVAGELYCNGSPASGVRVSIYDLDRNPGDSDDLLDATVTDYSGHFRLDGTTREFTSIEPELRIFHDCNDYIRPCQWMLREEIPGEYIHHGTVKKLYKIGRRDLTNPPIDKLRSCDGVHPEQLGGGNKPGDKHIQGLKSLIHYINALQHRFPPPKKLICETFFTSNYTNSILLNYKKW